jgi:hypothetical protein
VSRCGAGQGPCATHLLFARRDFLLGEDGHRARETHRNIATITKHPHAAQAAPAGPIFVRNPTLVRPAGKIPRMRRKPRRSGQLISANHFQGARPTPASERRLKMLLETPSEICTAVETGRVELSAPPLPLYVASPEAIATVDQLRNLQKLRHSMIRAQNRLILQAQAIVRIFHMEDDDFADDTAKEKARKRVAKIYGEVIAAYESNGEHPLLEPITPYIVAQVPLADVRAAYEKRMAKLARTLPVYPWVKSVKGFGDVSLAEIVGSTGDIGTYKSVSALWKRMGLAVINGRRQGAPGGDASKEDWIEHGYSGRRRSVMWNVGGCVIGGMGHGPRLEPGEDPDERDDLTLYQRAFVHRLRYEAPRCPDKDGIAVKLSAKGKESFTKHAENRARRYVEKMLLKHLYLEWRRAA